MKKNSYGIYVNPAALMSAASIIAYSKAISVAAVMLVVGWTFL